MRWQAVGDQRPGRQQCQVPAAQTVGERRSAAGKQKAEQLSKRRHAYAAPKRAPSSWTNADLDVPASSRPAPIRGSRVDATTGSPWVRFQCQGWPPYCAEAPASRLKRRNCQGTATQLQEHEGSVHGHGWAYSLYARRQAETEQQRLTSVKATHPGTSPPCSSAHRP